MPPPSVPRIKGQPLAKNQSLEFVWAAPADNGGSPITNYRFKAEPGGIVDDTISASTGYYKRTGLTNGVTYRCTLEASNDNGVTYSPVATFRDFQPGNPPTAAPQTATASVLGSTSAIVQWTPPAVIPDATIFWYVIESVSNNSGDPVKRITANGLTQTSYLIQNLNSTSTYYFKVRAVNCPGYSPIRFTSSISYIIVPGYIYATNFNNGNDIGMINYNAARLSTNTITGSGFSYDCLNSALAMNISSITTNTCSFCQSIYRTGSASFMGLQESRNQAAQGLIFNSGGSTLSYIWSDDSNTFNTDTGITPPLNTWVHVVLTISPTQAKWYINGVLQFTKNYTHIQRTFTQIQLGTSTVSDRWFRGLIDNIRFYNSTLTDSEVSQIYNNTLVV